MKKKKATSVPACVLTRSTCCSSFVSMIVHYPNCNSVQALTQRKLSHYAPPGKSILIP